METLIHGDCLEKLKEIPDNSIDSIVTDPPYGLSFMGKKWDYDVPSIEIWKECLRVLKPGGYLLSFGGTRTYHRMASAIEDAGFEVRDMIEWVYGCLSEDTEILTANGWKMLYSVFEGDYVFACDYKNDMKLQLEQVKQKFIYDYDEDAYHIKDTGYYNSELMETDHIVSKNHNVLVLESWVRNAGFGNNLYWEKIPAEKLYENIQKIGGKKTFRIPGLNGDIPCTIKKIPYKGKVWCVEVESGAFVARRKGKIFITGNSGFPKSLNIGKKIDHLIGNEALKEKEIEFVRWFKKHCHLSSEEIDKIFGWKNRAFHFFAESDSNRHIPNLEQYKILKKELSLSDEYDDFVKKHSLLLEEIREIQGYEKSTKNWDKKYIKPILNKSATEQAKEWEGWGTALKPAHEPITVARKSLIGTVAENILTHGTGGLNIDGSRVGTEEVSVHNAPKGTFAGGEADRGSDTESYRTHTGRWPANLIHDGSEEVLECFPNVKGATSRTGKRQRLIGQKEHSDLPPFPVYQDFDNTSAARFFYCAKASKKDRDEGLEGFEGKFAPTMGNGIGGKEHDPETATPKRNAHPTVKPTALMRYLVKLVTPKGGTVLDPFTGSGSTGKACKLEGFNFIGVEREEEYVKIARARIEAVSYTPTLL